MKRLVPAIVAVSAAVAACAASTGAAPAVSGVAAAAGPWGRAIEVPGFGALNAGGRGKVVSVSCASAGNCAVGGNYTDRHRHGQGFVADERHGRWSTAIGVPGLVALSARQGADVVSASCGAAGNCATGGYFIQLPNIVVPILATEHRGRWGKAVTLPRNALPGDGEVNSISCASAGNCLVAGGIAGDNEYFDTGNAFVLQERAGRWGKLGPVPGLRALEHGGDPQVAGSWINSVACPSAGNCTAGGAYVDRSGNQYAFVADERSGTWGTAIQVPGLAALNPAGNGEVTSVSCGAAGDCAAGGDYTDPSQNTQGFVAVEDNGTWGTAIPVPGLAALNAGGNALITSVSCGAAGDCAAGGFYTDGSRHHQGFVASEQNGAWSTAIEVPGLAALNAGGRSTQVLTVVCASAGDCAAGGFYSDRSHHRQGFVASEHNGVWGTAVQVPGLAALNAGGDAEVGSLSCPSPGKCVVGGFYTDAAGHHQGFVT